jgi:hypothetical protein
MSGTPNYMSPDGVEFYSPLRWTRDELLEFGRKMDPAGGMDMGIVRVVRILIDADIASHESCQGGEGTPIPSRRSVSGEPRPAGGVPSPP